MKTKKTSFSYGPHGVTEKTVKTVTRGKNVRQKTTTLENYNNPLKFKKKVTKNRFNLE